MTWWSRLCRWLHGYRINRCHYCDQALILSRGDFFVHLEPVCARWVQAQGAGAQKQRSALVNVRAKKKEKTE